jgi:hypothetical protein
MRKIFTTSHPWDGTLKHAAHHNSFITQLIKKSIEHAIESAAFDDMERVLMKRVEDKQPDIRAIALELLANFQVNNCVCRLVACTLANNYLLKVAQASAFYFFHYSFGTQAHTYPYRGAGAGRGRGV